MEGSIVQASQDTLYCVLEQDTLSSALIVNGSAQEKSQHDLKIVDWDLKHQRKQNARMGCQHVLKIIFFNLCM